MRLALLLVLLAASSSPIEQAQRAVAEAQQAMQESRFDDAVALLQQGLPAAAAIDDAEVRKQALSAMHFFSGLAYAVLGREAHANEQIEHFLTLNPGASSIDRTQYPAPFADAFAAVVKAVRASAAADFDRRHPGFRLFSTETPENTPLHAWDESPEFRHLATTEEREAWRALDSDGARSAFIEEFWRRRDPTPNTEENEFRTAFLARAAFADRTFAEGSTRGSLTDRGRVLLLLGRPPLLTWERSGPTAEYEAWGYGRDQLPARISQRTMIFRFVREGNREFVLPIDPEHERILNAAAERALRKR